jgi:hypothetical protein
VCDLPRASIVARDAADQGKEGLDQLRACVAVALDRLLDEPSLDRYRKACLLAEAVDVAARDSACRGLGMVKALRERAVELAPASGLGGDRLALLDTEALGQLL